MDAEQPRLTADERRGLESAAGVIFDIQRCSLHDGPGLRTNVFFKGCPLRCGWCANPESQTSPPEIAVFAANCIRCGQFDAPCPDQWQVRADPEWKRDVMAEYGERAAVCPVGGTRWIGEQRTAGSILAEVRRDKPFYAEGGGMTLTGGEPLLQPRLAEALLRLAKAESITTAVETCGYAAWPTCVRLVPYLDSILFDLKHMDDAIHRTWTGVSNEPILDNLRRLVAARAPVTVRVPLIPGFNATVENVQAIGAFVAGLGKNVLPVDVLPYHMFGRSKYAALARPYPWQAHERLTDQRIGELADVLRGQGLNVTIGG
jgi:pyruvate formate lyase activating enzyme